MFGLVLDEQLCLGLGVTVHVAVIIEMIAAQVGEHHRVEGDAVDAILRKRV